MGHEFEMRPEKIVIATRGSELAVKQAEIVVGLLSRVFPEFEFATAVVKTSGDRLHEAPLSRMHAKGVFVKEIEDCLERGDARLAVHSAKDLPVDLPVGLCLAAAPEREDFRDVLISRDGATLEQLPSSAVIGTSSPRRKAQLLAYRRDLRVQDIRGNLDTRIAKLRGERASPVAYDAIVVAAAGCVRAGLEDEIAEYIPPEIMLPSAGQGALALECREDDEEAMEMARAINDPETFMAVLAERFLVKHLGGGCHTPIAALATREGQNLRLRGAVLSQDGERAIRAESAGSPDEPGSVARNVAEELFRLGAVEIIGGSER
jgi:hydroxymethylbilane synthase